MKIFKGFNTQGPECPICKTKDDEECVLIPIINSNKEGENIYRSVPIHLDCLDLWYMEPDEETAIIVQKFEATGIGKIYEKDAV